MPHKDLDAILYENGYNPYSMPDRDFVPLAVVRLNDRKKFERVGLLPRFVAFPDPVSRPPDPALLPPQKKPDFSSLFTAQIDASLGLSLLKNIFAQMEVGGFSTEVKFNKVDRIELSYTNVISDSIDPVEIAAYLDSPAMPPQGEMIAGLLEEGRTFVIHDALKSDSFSVRCHAQETADAATEVKAIKDILKDESKIDIRQESETSLNFKGPGFQTFALRIHPFWITTGSSGQKQFFFRSKPPSLFERISGLVRWGRGVPPPPAVPGPSLPQDAAPAEAARTGDALYCKRCGTAIKPGARFCEYCGMKVTDSPDATQKMCPAPPPPSTVTLPQSSPSSYRHAPEPQVPGRMVAGSWVLPQGSFLWFD